MPFPADDGREQEVFDMNVLVAYATRHGSTRGIAERIGATLSAEGLAVTVKSVEDVWELTGYDAFVVGSAAYMGGWLNHATAFVRRNRSVLAQRPVWLFSSGPIGPDKVDKQGRDVLVASEPKEFAEFDTTINPVESKSSSVPSKPTPNRSVWRSGWPRVSRV